MPSEAAKRVLVVDDEQSILRMISVLLAKVGYTVETASDGIEALQMVRKFRPDIMILDVMMPKENGYRVSRKIKMLGSLGGLKIPRILLVTARDLSHDPEREQAMAAYSMADGTLYKPFKPTDLLAKLQTFTN